MILFFSCGIVGYIGHRQSASIAIKGHYEKTISNIQEIKSRKGEIIDIVRVGDQTYKAIDNHVIETSETLECLSPLLTTIPYNCYRNRWRFY